MKKFACIALATSFAFVAACKKEEAKTEPETATQPAPTPDEPTEPTEPQEVELANAVDFEAEAEAEIDEENYEDALGSLEAEINAGVEASAE